MKKVKNGIKIVIFILIFVMIFGAIQDLTLPYFSDEQGSNTGFFDEEDNTVDVIFLGSSNMFHTINPLVMYEEAGIRGFDFGSSSQSLNLSYMYLTEALKTQSPKVVCLEVYMASRDYNEEGLEEPELRWGFTHFPKSLNMMARLYDQVDGKIDAEYLSYVFPLLRYKSIWWNISKYDFIEESSYKKGCYIGTKVTPISYEDAYWEDEEWEISESNLKSLNQIKALCDEKDIELVLFKSPNATQWKNAYSEKMNEYAKGNDIPFIDYNLLLDELGIDVNTCFMDSGHLNLSGSILASKYMAEYLVTNYELQDYRNGEKNSWDRACEEWHRREQNELLMNIEDFEEYLDIISSGGYTVTFSINGEIDDEHKGSLLVHMGLDAASGIESGIVRDGTPVALNVRGNSYLWRDEIDGQDYAIAGNRRDNGGGNITYDATVYVNGGNCSVTPLGINIVVYDNELEEFVSVVGFAADDGYKKYFGSLDVIKR